MTWTVRWTRQATKDLKQLPPEIQRRVIATVHRSLDDPPRAWRRLRGGFGYRLRVRKYRVLGDRDGADQVVDVNAVGHRRNVYRR